ncbi:MAG: DNA polymerase I, partial [Candidatus Hydrogenedens sp.]
KAIFENNNLKKLGFDLKKSIQILHKNNINLQGAEMDIKVASYLTDTDFTHHSLEKIAERFLSDYVLSLEKSDASVGEGMSEIDIGKVCRRAEMIQLLYPIFREKLKKHSLETLYQEIEHPLISVLARMEERGIAINLEVFKELEKELRSRIAYLEQEIYKQAGMEFNINSPKQLQVVLFDKLGLKPIRKTKTGSSTDTEVLEELAMLHPLPAIIIEYRTLQKLLNTYIEALPKLVNPETGRIHTNFNQTVVATGRLSSSDPNLQNIPIRTEYGKRIREGFVATDTNWTLLSADYSQIELRILAHLSEDPILCEAFYNDLDIHRETASKVFGIPFEKVTEEQRRQAKAINFGVIYGMTPYGLSKAVGFSTSEASKFIDSYFNRFARVKEWLDKIIEEAKNRGYTTTLFNRRRYLSGLDSSNQIIRKSAERMAVNTPVQGSAADIIKKAMIEVDSYLKEVGAWLLLQVHDELLIEVPKKSAEEIAQQVKSIMEKVVSLRVPLKVDIGLGNNWAEAH